MGTKSLIHQSTVTTVLFSLLMIKEKAYQNCRMVHLFFYSHDKSRNSGMESVFCLAEAASGEKSAFCPLCCYGNGKQREGERYLPPSGSLPSWPQRLAQGDDKRLSFSQVSHMGAGARVFGFQRHISMRLDQEHRGSSIPCG